MSEVAETPFFPVPVRWFELPVGTGRWGFMRLDQPLAAHDVGAMPQPAAGSVSGGSAEVAAASPVVVGQLLNERA